MDKFDVTMVGLPKWPAIVVVGKPVTEEQAAEIIIRTNWWPGISNDRAWEKDVVRIVGFPREAENMDDWSRYDEEREIWWDKHGILEIDYLRTHQVMSAYLGGPHGWCNWKGTIGTTGSNIGKWPDATAVLEEWETIAKAFPFLDLRCQLFDRESCEEGARPVVEYRVEGGAAAAMAPGEPMDLVERDMEQDLAALYLKPNRERGCTPDKLKWAIELVRNKRS